MSKKVTEFPSLATIAGKLLPVFNATTGKGEKVTYEAFTDLLKVVFYDKPQIIALVTSSLAGVANPSTNPGTPLSNVYYKADGIGTYTYFLSAPATPIVVSTGEKVELVYSTDTGYWTKNSTLIAPPANDLTTDDANISLSAAQGVAVKLLVDLINSKISFISNINSDTLEIDDGQGGVGIKISNNGLEAIALISDVFKRRDGSLITDYIPSIVTDTTHKFIIQDELKDIGAYIDKDNTLWVYRIKEIDPFVSEGDNDTIVIDPYVPHIWGKPADYLVLDSYGQSLSIGEDGEPVQTTSQPYDSLMLDSGLYSSVYSNIEFTPLIEGTVAGRGETPIGGWTASIIEQIAATRFVQFEDKGFKFIGMATGSGGKAVSELTKTASPNYYNKGINTLQNIVNIATAENKTVAVAASTWIQGESNTFTGANTSTDSYITQVTALFNDRNTDYKAITGQSFDMVFFGYQMAYDTNDNAYIRLAHYKMHKTMNNFCIATPVYHIPYVSSQYIHMDGTGYRWMAEYFGIAYRRFLIEGHKNTITEPVYFKVSGNVITIKVKAPVLPLEIDTTNLAAADDSYGFKVYNSSNTRLTITTADVSVDYDTITINCPSSPAGGKVNYAIGGTNYVIDGTHQYLNNRGNIRDSQGDTVLFDTNRMDNWLVCFQQNL